MAFSNLHLGYDGAVATITLNRPEKRNALSFELLDELMAALDEVEQSSAQVLIVTGAGKAFCAGMDLEELKSFLGKSHDENVKDSAHMARIFRRIYDCGGEWGGDCGRHGHCHYVRLDRCSARSEVWLHRSSDRIRGGHCFFHPGLASWT